ncbi:hypothetical protein APU02_19260 [Citrobacter sp. 50677481]|nr:hypothetical protein APU02_19260 [Citrobacter sp. 50677481]
MLFSLITMKLCPAALRLHGAGTARDRDAAQYPTGCHGLPLKTVSHIDICNSETGDPHIAALVRFQRGNGERGAMLRLIQF